VRKFEKKVSTGELDGDVAGIWNSLENRIETEDK
jgi:hypothetical protein